MVLLFLLPGSIFTWFLYMFPSDGSYRTIRVSSRWYRSTLIKFFISCIFWFIILPYLFLELTEFKTLNYLKNHFDDTTISEWGYNSTGFPQCDFGGPIQNPEYIRVVEKLLYEHNYAVRIKTISKKDWVSKTLSSSSSRPSTKTNSSAVASKETKTVNQVKEVKTIEPVIEQADKPSPKKVNETGSIPLPEPTVDLNEEEDFNLEDLFDAE